MFSLIIKNEDVLNCIGSKIKKSRLEKKLTQNTLAEKVDISTDLLRNIENGRNAGSIATLINICNALDITTDFLFSDLLTSIDKQIDNNLHHYFQQISPEDRNIIQQIIIYLDKKYND